MLAFSTSTIEFRPTRYGPHLQVAPPYVPKVKAANDISNFDSEFTKEPAVLTPADRRIIESINQDEFQDFSFVNPFFA